MGNQPTLATDRLTLRPFLLSDASSVQRLAGDKRVALVTGDIPYPYRDGLAEQWISTHESAWQQNAVITYAVCDRDTGVLIGCVGLRHTARHARASLGYWIGVEHWGNGFCTESARAVMNVGFDRWALKRIEATHFVSNGASGAVMRKLGMAHEGTFRAYMVREGVSQDVAQYAILSAEASSEGDRSP